jgi:hypothetical protein
MGYREGGAQTEDTDRRLTSFPGEVHCAFSAVGRRGGVRSGLWVMKVAADRGDESVSFFLFLFASRVFFVSVRERMKIKITLFKVEATPLTFSPFHSLSPVLIPSNSGVH